MNNRPLTFTQDELSIDGSALPLPRLWGITDLGDGRVIIGTSGAWLPGQITRAVLDGLEVGLMDWEHPCQPFSEKYPTIDPVKLKAAMLALPSDYTGGVVTLEGAQ